MALGAGDSVVASGGGISGVKQYEGHITIYVLFASILATSTAVMGGYDAGITGEYFFLVSSSAVINELACFFLHRSATMVHVVGSAGD
jgi:hypothetical protein